MIYGLNTKDSDTILKFILYFCIHLNFPNKSIMDNGLEFKNSKLNDSVKKIIYILLMEFLIAPILKGLSKVPIIQ